jgi:sortase A
MTIDQARPLPPGHMAAEPTTPVSPRRHGFSWVAGLGELFIAAGLLLGLYVVWQLFYTDVQALRGQDALIESLDWADTVPAVVAGAPVESGDPPVMGTPDFTSTFAVLHVPRWGDDYARPVSEGITRRDVLDPLGIGHYPGTAMPGGEGNFAIAGHRTTYGKPFTDIDLLEVGDAIVVQTYEAWYVYRVTESTIVSPEDVEVVAPVPGEAGSSPDGRYITLTTCHPRYSAAQRWVVHGELESWNPVADGAPIELGGESA